MSESSQNGMTGDSSQPTVQATTQAPTPPAPEEPRDSQGSAPHRSRRRWPLLTAAAVAVLALGLGGGGYAYAAHYADVAVPGSQVAGLDVSGLTHDQIAQAVSDQAQQATLTIDGDVQATASLADLGVKVDAEATADAVMAASHRVVDRFTALATSNDVSPVTTADPATAQAYADSLVPSDEQAPVDATIVLGQDGASYAVVPAVSGTGLDAAALADAAQTAAETLSPQTITAHFITVDPAVSDALARTSADQANAIIAQDVTVTALDGTKSFTADAATKAAWVTVTPQEDAAPQVGVDATKVGEWVAEQTATVSKDPVAGVRNVDAQGKVMATPVQAVNGVAVTNAEDVTADITKALDGGQAYSGSFVTEEVEAAWTDRPVAAGAEKLAYAAAAGEKWVDINLSAKTVTAYEGADVVHGPVSVVDGAEATPTVTGTYHVYLKYASQTMRGKNADGSSYETPGVPWVTYFYQGYAMHGAPWRSSFGYSGSHGCLNMPVPEAKWMYNWSEIGTTVVVHR